MVSSVLVKVRVRVSFKVIFATIFYSCIFGRRCYSAVAGMAYLLQTAQRKL